MTNEELAELERQRDLEIRLAHAKDAEHALMQCVDELRATAREAEALRAENARLRGAVIDLADNIDDWDGVAGITEAIIDACRAALEQGEVK